MNNPESTLITKIHYLISQRRLFGEVKARGEEYYRNGNVETIFSPRPEELLAVVSEKKKHVVFMMLERGTLKMACSCGGMSPCKHAAAVSYYVADHRGELDSECLLDSFIKKQIEYSLIEMITFLNRLVGPQKLVTPMTEVDYYTLIGDFAILFVEELLSDIDKKMLAKYVLQYLSIASSASYFFCIQDTVFMNERIMIVLEAIFSLTEETENNFVEGLTKYLFLIDSNDLISLLKKYANEKEITDMYGKVVDILIEKASSLGQSYNGEDLIILKACNLFITDKEQFFEFAGQRMDIIPVRILVFRSWLKDHKTDLIIDTWNKYYDEQDFNIEETLLYLKALVINHNDISEKVKYFLKRKPSHEFFKSLKSNKLLSVNDPFYGDILKMVFSSFALDQKELILEELTNSKLKLDLCMDIKQVYEQTELFYKFFTEFFSVDEDRFIMKYQSCIIELYVGEQSMSKLLENLRLLENIPMGRFYIHHVIDYITSSYSLNYNNRIQLMDYQKRLELGR